MSRSAASRAAEDAAKRLSSMKPARRIRMGTCPLCDNNIYTNQNTTWRAVDGVTARIHSACQ
jgi:hypothetical protein